MALLELQTLLKNWTLDRPLVQENNTPERIIELLQNEVVEASQSLTDTENLASEIADIVIFALTLANHYGFDMDLEVREKIGFNVGRYSADLFQEGDYEEARLKAKQVEKDYYKRDFYQIPR